MPKELADSIVLAARKMEHNEVEVISVIRSIDNGQRFCILRPEYKEFSSFEDAYNYLVMKGYQGVSQDRDTHFKESLKVDKQAAPVVMIMSKKVNIE
jgi:hypothetical protein